MGMQVGPSVRAFDADNTTAEGAAAGFYTGKIQLHSRISQWQAARGVAPARDATTVDSTIWYQVNPITIKNFSAVCWLTGKNMFENLGGEVPVGLVVSSMGAHPIESWLGPAQLATCVILSLHFIFHFIAWLVSSLVFIAWFRCFISCSVSLLHFHKQS